jgi:vanillate O-demethylase ferredoxin subunit
MTEILVDMLIHAVTREAKGVHSFDLRPLDGGLLPAFTSGAHIDLHLPNGLVRSYSLVNAPAERYRYLVAVSNDANSAGGSRYLFDHPMVGQTIEIGLPRNNFSLVEGAPEVVLVAGGIGITPLYCMIQRMEEIGAHWRLFYGARERASAAFRVELEKLESANPGRVQFNFDLEDGRMLDVAAAVASAKLDAHLYCCGPAPMLEAFKAAASWRPPETVHLEYFAAPKLEAPSGAAFTVTVASSGQTYEIPEGRTILEVLIEKGVYAASSCRAGVCGACEVAVLAGEPDHKDYVLSDAERASNKKMMICVSGSKSDNLLLEL